jgi:pyrroloquinoline quinone biosynthesis protein B
LVNASPDLRHQLAATAALHPQIEPRGSPINSVILTGAEIDQIAGLLTLREETKVTLYATAATQAAIAANPIFSALTHIERRTVVHGSIIRLTGGLQAELFAVPGKLPLYLEDPNSDSRNEVSGVALSDGRSSIVVVPGASAITPSMLTRFLDAEVILFDGTLFEDDELLKLSAGTKTGRRMGHMPISGADGSLQQLSALSNRRIYIHVNNTNPIHVAGSTQRAQVEAAGWEISEDGQEITL